MSSPTRYGTIAGPRAPKVCLHRETARVNEEMFTQGVQVVEGVCVGGGLAQRGVSVRACLCGRTFVSGARISTIPDVAVCTLRNFSQMTHRPVTIATAQLTGPSTLCLSQCANADSETPRMVEPIAYLMADSESGSPNFYSSFLARIRSSRFVSEIFACNRQTDRQTTRTITISRPPHIVAGQLIKTYIL